MLALMLSVACYNPGDEFRAEVTGVPAIYHAGEMELLPSDDLSEMGSDPAAFPESVHLGQVGQDENPGFVGGVTYEFKGTGGSVCVVLDPEAVYWNYTVQGGVAGESFKYEDNYQDDGDLDISVGLTAYYTGSPGVEIGDFNALYTDQAGVDHTIAFDECVQTNLFGYSGIHAGRGSVEYCEIDTSGREGVSYTVLLKTFSLPIDDSILNFGTYVVELERGESCADLSLSECTLPNEVGYADPAGLPESKSWYPDLEQAFCQGGRATNVYCSENLAGENPPCADPKAP